jgi:hypothetical protein
MLGSSSWMPYAPQGVKGTDDDGESPLYAGHFYVLLRVAQNSPSRCPEEILIQWLSFFTISSTS